MTADLKKYAEQHGIDLAADTWFVEHWADKVTVPFLAWWIAFYGIPADYASTSDEQAEYWVRCGFALAGFLAGTGAIP